MNHPKFELFKDKADKFRFRLTAKNGQTILSASEGYSSKAACKKGVASVQKNAGNDDRFVKNTSDSGSFSFSLKAGNNEIIGRSQSYATEASRDKGIASVQANAPDADIDDQS